MIRDENFNENFLKQKIGATIDKWEKDGKKQVNVSYWIDKGKQRYRVNIIADTLDQAIDQARIQEVLIP